MSTSRSERSTSGAIEAQDLDHDEGVVDAGDSHFQLPHRPRPAWLDSSGRVRNENNELRHEYHADMDENDSDTSSIIFTPEPSIGDEDEMISNIIRDKWIDESPAAKSRRTRKFYEAIERGDVEAVTVLLTEGCSANRKTGNGYTPLVIAILKGHLEMAKFLLENNANVHQRVNKLPPIVHAVTKPTLSVRFVQLLLDYGAIASTPLGPYHYNALHWAISNGNVDGVDLLVSRGMDMEETCGQGRTALLVAARFGQTTILKVLLAKGASSNHKCHNGDTALNWAARYGHMDTVKVLLDEGFDVDDCNGRGVSPLWIASSSGYTEVVGLLIEYGADINLTSSNPQSFTPIMAAAINGHTEVVQLLLKHSADLSIINCNGNTVLISALHQRRLDVFDMLLEAIYGPSYPKDTLARDVAMTPSYQAVISLVLSTDFACSYDNATRRIAYNNFVKRMLAHDGQVLQKYALSAVMEAAMHESDSILVEVLLNHGFGPSDFLHTEQTPLHFAASRQDYALVDLLLQRGADPAILSRNFEGNKHTPLDQALLALDRAATKDTLIVDMLLATKRCKLMKGEDMHSTAFNYVLSHDSTWEGDLGRDIAVCMVDWTEDIQGDRSDDGSTLLHAAIYHGRTDIADILLSRGADINATNAVGCTPFFLECQHNPQLLRFLLSRKADPRIKNADGQSALHIAAGSGKLDIVDFLIDLDLDLEDLDHIGYTPLQWALIRGQEDAVLHLYHCGAELPSEQFRRRRTMLHVAASLGMVRFVEMLLAKEDLCMDVNARDDMGWTALALACRNGTTQLESALLGADADVEVSPDNTSNRPLHLALRAGNQAVAEQLILHGADITVKGDHAQTPLHFAAQLPDPHIVQILLTHSANISALDESGHTALFLCNDATTAQLLIDSGAHVDHKDESGWTPAHFAVRNENLELFTVLVQNGADVDARTLDDGISVLERIGFVVDVGVRRGMEEIKRKERRDEEAAATKEYLRKGGKIHIGPRVR